MITRTELDDTMSCYQLIMTITISHKSKSFMRDKCLLLCYIKHRRANIWKLAQISFKLSRMRKNDIECFDLNVLISIQTLISDSATVQLPGMLGRLKIRLPEEWTWRIFRTLWVVYCLWGGLAEKGVNIIVTQRVLVRITIDKLINYWWVHLNCLYR